MGTRRGPANRRHVMSNVSDLWAVQQTDLAVEAIRRRLKEI